MTDWHYSANGAKAGPVSLDELKAMFRDGRVNTETLVWTGSFGSDWRKASEVPDLHDNSGPPPLPVAEISDVWVWCMAAVPACGYLIEKYVTNATGTDFAAPPGIFIAYALLNSGLAALDEKAIRKSGRKTAPILAAAVLAPAYIFWRNRRLKTTHWPLAAWIASFLLAISTEGGFDLSNFGTTSPTCASSTSIAQVTEIFPRLPMNFAKLTAANVKNFSTTSKTGEQTICTADVVTSNGATIPVEYRIEHKNGQYQYWLNLKY